MTASQDQGASLTSGFGQKPSIDKGLGLSLPVVVLRHFSSSTRRAPRSVPVLLASSRTAAQRAWSRSSVARVRISRRSITRPRSKSVTTGSTRTPPRRPAPRPSPPLSEFPATFPGSLPSRSSSARRNGRRGYESSVVFCTWGVRTIRWWGRHAIAGVRPEEGDQPATVPASMYKTGCPSRISSTCQKSQLRREPPGPR